MDVSPTNDPEVALMLAAKADVPGAFDRLVVEVTPFLLRFLIRQCGQPDLAEDLAQETWLKLWRVRHDYRAGARFRTFLYRIAVNTHLNKVRSESYRATLSLDASSSVDGDALGVLVEDPMLPPPESGLETEELRAAVRQAVDGLPTAQRAAVILLRYEELSYEEIAETLDMSLQAVKSLLNRAKTHLASSLAHVHETGRAAIPAKGVRP